MIQHRLKLHTDKDAPKDQGVVMAKTIPFQEQHLRFLLGKRRQSTLSWFPATALDKSASPKPRTFSWHWPVPSVIPGAVVMPRERHRSKPLRSGAESDHGGGTMLASVIKEAAWKPFEDHTVMSGLTRSPLPSSPSHRRKLHQLRGRLRRLRYRVGRLPELER